MGALVVALAQAVPNASVHGVEMSPFPYLISRLRTRSLSNVSLRFKLASSLRWDWRLLLLTFVPAAFFPGSCRKAYPKALWHRGAPCSPFGLIYQGSQWILSCWIRTRSRHSGSGTTLRGGLPCREPAGVSRCCGTRMMTLVRVQFRARIEASG